MLKYSSTISLSIKKSNFLEDRFKLSGFSLKIYNVDAGNRRYVCMLTWDQALFFFLLPCFLGRLQSMIAGYASVLAAQARKSTK